jgi:hypothetical protein
MPLTRNVWLIARREYLERIRTRGFLITTIMIPLIMGGFIFGSVFLGSKADNDRHIAVVSSDTQLVLDLQDELERQQQQKQESPDDPENGAPPTAKKSPRISVEAMGVGPTTRREQDRPRWLSVDYPCDRTRRPAGICLHPQVRIRNSSQDNPDERSDPRPSARTTHPPRPGRL